MATIMNQPVFGFKREKIFTRDDILGESKQPDAVPSPNALRAFIEEGARIQKAQKEAQRG